MTRLETRLERRVSHTHTHTHAHTHTHTHTHTGQWVQAERGARVSATEVEVRMSARELAAKGVAGSAGKGASLTQVTREADVRLKPYWWRSLKDEDMISLEPLRQLRYPPCEPL